MLLNLELRDSKSHDSTGLKFDDFSYILKIGHPTLENIPTLKCLHESNFTKL